MSVRMNISVPDDLKVRMDSAPQTNWSAIASRAFADHLTAIAARNRKRALNMQETIERLRASKSQHTAAEKSRGYDAGVLWAKDGAEAANLERLAGSRDPVHDWYFGIGSSAYSSAEQFFFIIEPEEEGERGAAQEFWELWAGENVPVDDDYVHGFAEGACDVWAEVADKL